jgi:hypothetical protein
MLSYLGVWVRGDKVDKESDQGPHEESFVIFLSFDSQKVLNQATLCYDVL